MTAEESEQLFHDKSQIYWKWLLKIHSRRLKKPVLIAWMTDRTIDDSLNYENSDKLVLTTANQIVGAYDHKVLLQYLTKHRKRLPDPVYSITWLNEVSGLDAVSASDYHLEIIENTLDGGGFNKASITESLSFINLFRDFADMLKDDEPYYLSRKRQIRELSDFGYEIFWKEWGHEEVPAIIIPHFTTNVKLLHRRLNLMIDTFIGSIKILDNETSVANKKKKYKVLRHRRVSVKGSYQHFHRFGR